MEEIFSVDSEIKYIKEVARIKTYILDIINPGEPNFVWLEGFLCGIFNNGKIRTKDEDHLMGWLVEIEKQFESISIPLPETE